MPNQTEPSTTSKKSGYEFTLVLIMLGVLTILVVFILYANSPRTANMSVPKDFNDYLKEKESILNYRKDLLAIIIAAFGAWVGAGAAYFFGRENLRESANSLLQLHRQFTGQEKLAAIKVRDIGPKPLNANYDENSTLKVMNDKLAANPAMWFVSVKVDDTWRIVNNQGLFMYIKTALDTASKDQANANKTYAELDELVLKMTLKDAVKQMLQSELLKKFVDQRIIVKLDDNAAEVNQQMDAEGKFIAIITDEHGNFVQYFTTSDIRKALINT
jgi:hypothetical protein